MSSLSECNLQVLHFIKSIVNRFHSIIIVWVKVYGLMYYTLLTQLDVSHIVDTT